MASPNFQWTAEEEKFLLNQIPISRLNGQSTVYKSWWQISDAMNSYSRNISLSGKEFLVQECKDHYLHVLAKWTNEEEGLLLHHLHESYGGKSLERAGWKQIIILMREFSQNFFVTCREFSEEDISEHFIYVLRPRLLRERHDVRVERKPALNALANADDKAVAIAQAAADAQVAGLAVVQAAAEAKLVSEAIGQQFKIGVVAPAISKKEALRAARIEGAKFAAAAKAGKAKASASSKDAAKIRALKDPKSNTPSYAQAVINAQVTKAKVPSGPSYAQVATNLQAARPEAWPTTASSYPQLKTNALVAEFEERTGPSYAQIITYAQAPKAELPAASSLAQITTNIQIAQTEALAISSYPQLTPNFEATKAEEPTGPSYAHATTNPQTSTDAGSSSNSREERHKAIFKRLGRSK